MAAVTDVQCRSLYRCSVIKIECFRKCCDCKTIVVHQVFLSDMVYVIRWVNTMTRGLRDFRNLFGERCQMWRNAYQNVQVSVGIIE